MMLPIADSDAPKLPFSSDPSMEPNGLLAVGEVALKHDTADLQVGCCTLGACCQYLCVGKEKGYVCTGIEPVKPPSDDMLSRSSGPDFVPEHSS